jgi:divalent metal cation (Fe/Co/Zn/Cd) transporter
LSWRTAHRQLRTEAAARHLDLGEYLVTSSDPTPTAVFLEDSAALVGVGLALAALVLHITTGSVLWDGAARLLIGLLLIAVAVVLMRRNLALLIDVASFHVHRMGGHACASLSRMIANTCQQQS